MIPKQTIDEIFEAAIIEDVVGEFVPLKKRGANFLGNCPFHNEKTPSFTVSPTKGIYKCFGCGKAGNSVNFIMEHEHYSYPEALRFLANKYNIEVEEEELSIEQKQAANERESLYIVSNYASDYFQKQLHASEEGKAIGLSYFMERGFREDIIKKFQLGYSPDKWSALTDEAEKEGYNLSFLEKTGLTIVKGEKKYDRFKGRVIFPIHNLSGRILGFGGRILKMEAKAAKYLNSPESEIYHKSNVLYGIYYAKKSITKEDNCFLVEGYTDVISLHQSGIENVVASSGTSLTENQIRLIKRFTPNTTILYDGDPAGIKASFRGIDMVLREGMNVRVVLFPEGEDPDSYSKKSSSQELKEYIQQNTQDFIRFKTSILIKEVGNDPIKRVELIRDVVSSIAVISDQIKRSVYIKECSTLLEVPEQALISEINKILRKNFSKKSHPSTPQIAEGNFPPLKEEKTDNLADEIKHWEFHLIRLLIKYGDQTIELSTDNDETESVLVALYIVSNINSDDIMFENEVYQKVCTIYTEKLNKEELPTHHFFTNHEESNIKELAIDILSNQYELSTNWEKHRIYTSTEEQQLKKAIYNTLYAFKLSKLNLLIMENQEQLKAENSEKETLNLLKVQLQLHNIKKQLADKLGRVVLK